MKGATYTAFLPCDGQQGQCGARLRIIVGDTGPRGLAPARCVRCDMSHLARVAELVLTPPADGAPNVP